MRDSCRKWTFGWISISILLISCQQIDRSAEEPNYEAAAYVQNLNTSDTFRYESAVDGKGRFDSIAHDSKASAEKLLRLSSLKKGFDSIQIRISWGCAIQANSYLVILKNQNKKWSAEICSLKSIFNEEKGEVDSISNLIKIKTPKSGWKNFINVLIELKIFTLEDNNSIPGFYYAMPTDGCGVAIEIATKKIYRFYNYDNPGDYADRYWQAKNILAILKLVIDEFGIITEYDYWPPHKFRKKYEEKKPAEQNKIKIREVILEPDTTKI